MMPGKLAFFTLAAAALVASCSSDPLKIDTSATHITLGYRNLDSLINLTDTADLKKRLLEWHVAIPEAIDFELGYCIGAGRVTDPQLASRLHEFRTNAYIARVEKRIAETFPDLPKRHAEITEGFRRVKTHLPDAAIPANIVYLNSTHRASAFSTEKEVAVGLEMYLGAKTDVTRELPSQLYYEWQKEGMDKKFLERDVLASWIMTHIVQDKEDASVIEKIVDWGKILYFTEAAFPEIDPAILLRYSKSDLDWAMEHERDFWKYLVDQKLLFKKDPKLNANFLSDAPFTAGLPQEGPDRLGQFLGWRIIHSYMEQYDITLQQLKDLSYTEILTEYEIE